MRRSSSASASSSSAASTSGPSCSVLRALAIGASTVGRERSQARATAATGTEWALDVPSAGAVLAGEEAFGEAPVGEDGEVLVAGEILERPLERLALDQAVVRLQGDVAGQPIGRGDRQRLGEARGAVVGGGDLAHLARLDQLAEGPEDLRQRHALVVLVGVVEVDAIGPEATQRRVAGGADVVRGEASEVRVFGDLRRDHHPLAGARTSCPPSCGSKTSTARAAPSAGWAGRSG